MSIIPDSKDTIGITTLLSPLTPEKMYLSMTQKMEKTENVRVELLLAPTSELQREQRIELCSQF